MQKIDKRRLAQAIGMAFLAVGVQSAAQAADIGDKVSIYGYGDQSYIRSADNTYLDADSKGTFNNQNMALMFNVKIDDKTKIWLQYHANAEAVLLDWAFVDYKLNDNLSWRAGQLKQPFGLYNDVLNARFLQLSALAPMLYQGAASLTPEALRGAATSYSHEAGGGSLSWDAYAGQVDRWRGEGDLEGRKYGTMTGGRVTYKTPVDGLKFMASTYKSAVSDVAPLALANGDKKAWALSADYNNNNFDVKAEYGKLKLFTQEAESYYVQAGYTFEEKWMPYVRYDYATTDVTQRTDPSHYQKTKVLGLNYKINTSVAVRLENHWNDGYAMPVASGEVVAGTGKKDWKMLAANISYIF